MIKRVLQHFFKQKNVILLLILSIIVFFISIISPYLNSVFIDSLVFNSLNFKEIIIISIFIMFLNILGIVLTFFTSLLNVKIYNFTNFSILKEVFNNIYICKIEFLNKFDSSYLTQRVISDINIITNYVINTVKDIMFNFCILAFIIFTFLKIDRWLVIFIIFLIIPYSILYIKIKKPLQNAYKQKKENEGIFFNRIFDRVNQIQFTQTNSLYDKSIEKIQKSCKEYYPYIEKSNRISILFSSIDSFLIIIFQSIMIIFCGIKILKGSMTIGNFTMINMYFNLFVKNFKKIIDCVKNYPDAQVSYNRIVELERNKILRNDVQNEIKKKIEVIELRDITYSYNKTENVLDGLNMIFKKNNIYCVKGKNGSGKSTLLNILAGVYFKYTGDIFINEKKIYTKDYINYREQKISVLLQNLIRENIEVKEFINSNFDSKEILDERVKKLKFESLTSSVNEILQKNMMVLSGGELERLYLWIALLKEKEVLILDEPTNGIDVNGKKELIEYLKEYKKEKIIIIFSHEKDIIDTADFIYNIDYMED